LSNDEVLETLRSLHGQIEEEYKARIEGIFGSRARGEDHAESDLDVLVDFQEKATLYDLVGLADFLESILQCNVDVVSKRALRDEIAPDVLRDLVRL